MSDRIAVMHRGKVEQVGAPEDLYDRPTTPFVADFIGTTNLLSGTVEGLAAGIATVRLDSGDLCQIVATGRRAGQAIQLSVRPEAIAIEPGNGRDQASDGRLQARVEQMAYLGSAVQYHVRTDGGLALSVLAGKNGSRYGAGDFVELTWVPAEALVLGDRAAELEDEP